MFIFQCCNVKCDALKYQRQSSLKIVVEKPCSAVSQFLFLFTTRFVKFYLHTTSRLVFLSLLLYSIAKQTVITEDEISEPEQRQDPTDEELRESYFLYKGANIHLGQIFTVLFVIGMYFVM